MTKILALQNMTPQNGPADDAGAWNPVRSTVSYIHCIPEED
ncbi:hypothetical protein OHS33_31795 [Streptomyces sp. NBC_00536]|nr:hypothetical protein [Streptomyces sp. NBC_00536]WUC82539.1 hypothetical protein OHS33_31795 [Streptomyces sp. NBC_00536]